MLELKAISEKTGNILKREDKGTFYLEARAVKIKGKPDALYEIKLPKTAKTAIELYGEEEVLKSFIATLRTDSDDEVREGGKPKGELKKIMSGFKAASEDTQAKIKKLLEEEAKKASEVPAKPVTKK